jgi:hypothetical protein
MPARLLRPLGWVLAAGSVHFGFEVMRAVLAKPTDAMGGYASLSRLTTITGLCFWASIPWLLVALWMRMRAAKEEAGESKRLLGGRLILVVAIACGLAAGALLLARTQNIALFY